MQNIISANSNELSMSSQEIADLVGARHDSVKRSIERLAEQGVITFPPTVEKATGGRPSVEYVFSGEKGKRDSIIVVAQLSPEFTARLVDRWQELEGKVPALPDFTNPVIAARAWADEAEAKLLAQSKAAELEQKMEKIQPMADALIRIAHSDGGVNLTTAAKVLHQKPKHFIASLAARGLIYKRPGSSSWCGYQDILNRGYVDHKVTTIERNDGSEKSVVQCLVTPKGIAKLSLIFGVQPDTNGGLQ